MCDVLKANLENLYSIPEKTVERVNAITSTVCKSLSDIFMEGVSMLLACVISFPAERNRAFLMREFLNKISLLFFFFRERELLTRNKVIDYLPGDMIGT